MFSLFLKGGPVMWPLLITSLFTLAVVIERFLFLWRESRLKQPETVDKMFAEVETGRIDEAISLGEKSQDCVATILTYGLRHRKTSLTNALLRAANLELKQHAQGLPVLDTVITLAPLLGLLGTVWGILLTFSQLQEKGAIASNASMLSGLSLALATTVVGLLVAIPALVGYNYLKNGLREYRREAEDFANLLLTSLELYYRKPEYAKIQEPSI